MRSFLIATGILVLAAQVSAQSTSTAAPAPKAVPAADETAPPLIKSVEDDPNDSPMVRAAKRAVASRQNAGQRRVVSLTTSSATTRGRVAVSSGSAEGPKVPPLASDARHVPPPKPVSAQERAARHQAEVREKLKNLAAEEQRIAAELEEEHPEMDEDFIDKRIEEIAAERKKLQDSLNSPPPPR
jgi:small-conductance mechanosensitive channel